MREEVLPQGGVETEGRRDDEAEAGAHADTDEGPAGNDLAQGREGVGCQEKQDVIEASQEVGPCRSLHQGPVACRDGKAREVGDDIGDDDKEGPGAPGDQGRILPLHGRRVPEINGFRPVHVIELRDCRHEGRHSDDDKEEDPVPRLPAEKGSADVGHGDKAGAFRLRLLGDHQDRNGIDEETGDQDEQEEPETGLQIFHKKLFQGNFFHGNFFLGNLFHISSTPPLRQGTGSSGHSRLLPFRK